jgi:hypothetical protein
MDAELGSLPESEPRVVLGMAEHDHGSLTAITRCVERRADGRAARTLTLVRRQDGDRPE